MIPCCMPAACTSAFRFSTDQAMITVPARLPSLGLKAGLDTRMWWPSSSVRRLSEPVAAAVKAERSGCARSEEHTSELQSLMRISYAVFCLKKKKQVKQTTHTPQDSES